MRVVIAGGRSRTDFLIESLVRSGNEVVVINVDRAWCEYLSAHHNVPVICGDATKRYVLDDADIEGFDLMIALSDSDADNLVICHLAQRFFGIDRQVCTAYNPRNVPVFKKLGITSVVSATYLLSKYIEETSVQAMGSDARRVAESVSAPAVQEGWRGATGSMLRVLEGDEADARDSADAGAQADEASSSARGQSGRWIHGDGRHD